MANQELAKGVTICRTESGRGYAEPIVNRLAKTILKKDRSNKRTASVKNGMAEVHPEGRIIDKRYNWRGVTDIYGLLKDTPLLDENRALLERFISDAENGRTIKKRAKKKPGALRLLKYLQDLKKLDAYFQKPLDQVTQSEMERFAADLERGRLKQKNGKPYAAETQVCIKKVIIKFYKWLGRPDVVESIDTSYDLKDYRAISKDQLDYILEFMTSNNSENLVRNRALISFLFDSGARADELLNVRLEDLTLEGGTYKVRITISKTYKRTIQLPICSRYLAAWLDKHPLRGQGLAQLFPLSYSALVVQVARVGEILKLKLTPHSLRHASATYWARQPRVTRYQLCYRMGWGMSSKQPDRYIDKEGLGQEVVTEAVEADAARKYSRENDDLRQQLAILRGELERYREEDKRELQRIIEIVEAQTGGEK